MKVKNKWFLWLQSTTVTVIFILLLLEVLIVSNEAKRLLNENSVRVVCTNESLNLDYGTSKMQLGPSLTDMQKGASLIVNNVLLFLPPFNLIHCAKKLVDLFF